MPPLRQAFDAGGNHFSFATPLAKKSHGDGGQPGVEHGTWIGRVKGSYGYASGPDDLKSGPRAWGNRGGLSLDGEELRRVAKPDRARPAARLVPVYPISSQAQSMAKYRQEMMELVKGVPESAYELSLRDLVEIPMMVKAKEAQDVEKERAGGGGGGGGPEIVTRREKEKKEEKEKKVKKKQILRSSSMDSGVFQLKMFFPQSLGWKSRSGAAGSCAKVSPKPLPSEGETIRPEKNMDAEPPEGCGEMIGSGDRNHSSGKRRKKIGCSPFSIKGRIRR